MHALVSFVSHNECSMLGYESLTETEVEADKSEKKKRFITTESPGSFTGNNHIKTSIKLCKCQL